MVDPPLLVCLRGAPAAFEAALPEPSEFEAFFSAGANLSTAVTSPTAEALQKAESVLLLEIRKFPPDQQKQPIVESKGAASHREFGDVQRGEGKVSEVDLPAAERVPVGSRFVRADMMLTFGRCLVLTAVDHVGSAVLLRRFVREHGEM